MGADSSDIYRSLEQRIDNVMILGEVLKTEPKSKQKTGTGNRGLGGTWPGHSVAGHRAGAGQDILPQIINLLEVLPDMRRKI